MWTRNQGLKELVAAVRAASGTVDPESELGHWLSWAETYANSSDPLGRFRDRKGDCITLYYSGYDHDRIAERGFSEPEPVAYGTEKAKAGVELTDCPPRLTSYETALKVELSEDLLLSYEWPQESDHYWRVFRPPAELLNRVLGFGAKLREGANLVEADEPDDLPQ